MFVYSDGTPDPSVSYLMTSVLESPFLEGQIILHSAPYHLDYADDHRNGHSNQLVARSAEMIAKEAIYQLIESRPAVLQNRDLRESIGTLNEKSRLQDIVSCLKAILLQILGLTTKSTSGVGGEVIWVVDRIDLCTMGRANARLSVFVQELQELIIACRGRLRVMLVSTHEPSALDKQWDPDQIHGGEDEDDWDLARKRTWLQVPYRVRTRRGA
jgi:hypothetical protein